MLRLGQHVGRDEARIGFRAGQYHDFAGSRDHIDIDLSEHLPLGCSDIRVARADNFIDARDRFGAVCQGCDSLRAADQVNFILTFVRCEGRFNRMEDELNISYPTIRNRLYEIIRALGYEPGGAEEPAGLTDQERKSILEDLDKGLISADRAMLLLQEKGG